MLSPSFIYYANTSTNSVIAGIGLGTLFLAIYLLFPDYPTNEPFKVTMEHIAVRFGAGYGIYLAVFGALVGLNVLHVSHAPITDIDKLVRVLYSDLVTNKGLSHGSVYYVFPAPDIGLFRVISEFIQKGPYETLRKNMPQGKAERSMIRNLELYMEEKGKSSYEESLSQYLKEFINVFNASDYRAIIYPPSLLPEFYMTYAIQTFRGTDTELINAVKLWYDHTKDSLDAFNERIINNPTQHPILYIKPNEFPQHIIIIGSVVYTIHTFGMPFFDSETSRFFPNKDDPKSDKGSRHFLADLIAYRRDDYLFAYNLKHEIDAMTEHLISLNGDDAHSDVLVDIDWQKLLEKCRANCRSTQA